MKIRVNLSATTRMDWSGVVEVPNDITDAEIQGVAEAVRDEVDSVEYNDDTDYWEEGPSYAERIEDNDPATFSLVDGKLVKLRE